MNSPVIAFLGHFDVPWRAVDIRLFVENFDAVVFEFGRNPMNNQGSVALLFRLRFAHFGSENDFQIVFIVNLDDLAVDAHRDNFELRWKVDEAVF